MVALITSPIFNQHDTGSHPESAGRNHVLIDLVQFEFSHLPQLSFQPADGPALFTVHSQDQIEAVADSAATGGGEVGPEAMVSKGSNIAARSAAGAAIASANHAIDQNEPVFCIIRPPGHHANHKISQGFCLFNNVAIAAKHLLSHRGLERILVVDWDVHHGNGTQDIFYEDERLMFFSIHRYPFYPGTGSREETGTGKGLGFTINEPIASGTSAETVKDRFRRSLEKAASKIKPQAILISAGFDGHRLDPLGSLNLSEADFGEMTREVVGIANHYCPGRIISCLEGGYNLNALKESARNHILGLETC